VLFVLLCEAHKDGTALRKIVKKFKKLFKKVLTKYAMRDIINMSSERGDKHKYKRKGDRNGKEKEK
jgi:hypothetical protein